MIFKTLRLFYKSPKGALVITQGDDSSAPLGVGLHLLERKLILP